MTTCEFSPQPENYRDTEEFRLLEIGSLECDRTTSADRDHCLIHSSDHNTNKQEILSEALSNGETLYGARADRLDLRQIGADQSTEPIDLRCAHIGTLDIRDTTVERPLLLDGATIDTILATETTFNARVSMASATIQQGVDFESAIFRESAYFADVVFFGEARFANMTARNEFVASHAQIDTNIDLNGASFEALAAFQHTTFGGWSDFTEVDFQKARFDEATFHDIAQFEESSFADAVFNRAEFGGAVFRDSSFTTGKFHEASFNGWSRFDNVSVEESMSFVSAEFSNTLVFEDSGINGGLIFTSARFDGDPSFRFDGAKLMGKTTLDGISFTQGTFTGAICNEIYYQKKSLPRSSELQNKHRLIDFTDANIKDGELTCQDQGEIYYDLTDATIGSVSFATENGKNPFKNLSVYRTEFDFFDFSRYRSYLSPNWNLHTISDQAPIEQKQNNSELETTYLKAKNGAEDAGDNRSASQFFLKELRYRRRDYLTRAKTASPQKSAVLWARAGFNFFYDITSGYGERPASVVISAGTTILLFSAAFFLMFTMVGRSPPYADQGPSQLSYLVFSMESFVQFVLPTDGHIESLYIRGFASLEGFIGAFFIGLFVFTLTRSVHR
ncbi:MULTISPECIES: pentapeptide repeat-containing protein [Halolamina]|uniref:Pentapeptide repeat-containing protein n=1 Tax=Halolamina pelagica TaxID=699431 RepID=A0A1I5UMU8_9EURY|nr:MULTISPECIES: pentapeptide repeat-containing protein [Halolamina]NHX37617.1 pentapeptide repeat-containing protein [Halolamina sp. R1-12]SFP96634.1 Pentapeptide repeat-containing protein [Halolamina pelagica]